MFTFIFSDCFGLVSVCVCVCLFLILCLVVLLLRSCFILLVVLFGLGWDWVVGLFVRWVSCVVVVVFSRGEGDI